MIDSGFGLEIWAESGAKQLEKRKRVLSELREKLLSPQPPKKKTTVKFYTKPFLPHDTGTPAVRIRQPRLYIQCAKSTRDYLDTCVQQWYNDSI